LSRRSLKKRKIQPLPLGPRRAVIVDDDLGNFEAPIVCLFVPPAIVNWAENWLLSAPILETQACGLRRMWQRDPEAAASCTLHFSSLPTILASDSTLVPTENEWKSFGIPAIGANPMVESEREFPRRARDHYSSRGQRYYEADADTTAPGKFIPRQQQVRDLHRRAGWLARVQVGKDSPTRVAKDEGLTPPAVDQAVRKLAAFLELKLRPLPKPGRPPLRVEASPRRRNE
jgi:hypothetical protein